MTARRAGLWVGLALLATAPAQADPRDDALNAVAKCASLADAQARLACYDAAAPKVKDALSAPSPPAQAQQGESWFGLPTIFGGNGRSPQTTPEQFGNESLPPPPPPPPKPGEAPPPQPVIIDSISAGVSDFAFHLDGRFTVFLDNGQIWQQIPGDTDRAKFKKGPNTVVISRGLMGSYELVLNGLGAALKVKRIK
jgi:hypothetical protein